MDLDGDDIDAVTVWVARVRRSDGESIVTAWSYHDKARSWCAHELEAEGISWEETEAAGPGKGVTGYVSGSKVASIQQVEVMDPVSLSRQYPTEMPAARDVLDDE
jgi:hypothetical protein